MLWPLFVSVVIIVALWKYFNHGQNDLARLPGPPKAPIVGSALAFIGLTQEEIFKKIIDLPSQYGTRVVISAFGRYILHIYGVEDIEIVLSHSRNITKSKPYRFMEPWLGTGLLVSTGNKWHRRRKILTPTFHFDILKTFLKVFEEQSRSMVDELRKLTKEGKDVLDVIPFISDYMLYSICETAMGIKLDSDTSQTKIEYKEAILDIGSIVMERLTKIYLHNDFIFYLHPLGKRFAKSLKKVHSFADNVIMERKKAYDRGDVGNAVNGDNGGSKRRLALLDLLLEAERKGEIDLEGIREEVNTFMFEGHDTTATALSFGLMLLADHEEVQERIFEEYKSLYGDSDQGTNMSDLGDMKYLEAVIKEILRLYPSVPFIGREIVEDFMLDDIKVLKGEEVVVHIYDVQRRADLYPEPEAFKPERFLEVDSRHPYAYVPFSAGPRNCIGQRFAKMEMKCALSEIVRKFRLQPMTRGARPTLKADIVLRCVDPIHVRLIPR
ncbi:cytochrome P450 4C1-like [Maniola jurtina]|uniref:cytochrome P450 4C1-like n=1 Tax=Maniola jurtina TaxID=191418 RepID=UPI001E68974F|nr:cytochrome P450 4C1-like [Maniola jurtina]